VDDGNGGARLDLLQVRHRRGLQDVSGQVEVGVAVGHGGRRDVGVGPGDVQVGDHRAGLLREAGLIDALDDEAGAGGGVAEEAVGGDDAGAADAGRVHAEPAVDVGDGRGGKVTA